MHKLNIIQRRELEPLLLKASKIVKYYEKASNCCAYVMGPDFDSQTDNFNAVCGQCSEKQCAGNFSAKCASLHIEAVNKARSLGGSYIYPCNKGLVFWTSPFYSGERLAGALFSGGIRKSENNNGKLKALAQIMLLCADQISGKSFVQKNVVSLSYGKNKEQKTDDKEQRKIKKDSESFSQPAREISLHEFANQKIDITAKDHICQLEMERMLLASLRRGDTAEGQKILVKLLNVIYQEVNSNFKTGHRTAAFRLKAIELAVLLTRAVSDPKDIKENTAIETMERCLTKIEESTNFEEISGILSSITERMSDKIFSFHGIRHFSAIRKAERFIWTHYTRKLSLKEIADASGLSAPYLSTVFKEEMGENLSNYLNRLRIEKAAAMLITTNLPISEISKTCGFEDQSWFSKIFKNNTNLTPGKYRERGMTTGGIYAEGSNLC